MAEIAQYLIVFTLGGIAGIGIMALMNVSAANNEQLMSYRLYIALNNLYFSCLVADSKGDLSGYISGQDLEESQNILEIFRGDQ